jgi:hypothetical protein
MRHLDLLAARVRQQRPQARVGAICHAKARDTAGAERLGDRVDSVDQHRVLGAAEAAP